MELLKRTSHFWCFSGYCVCRFSAGGTQGVGFHRLLANDQRVFPKLKQAEDKGGIMSTMTHIRDVRKKAPMVTGLFGPLKDTVLLLKSRGIAMDLPPVNKQVSGAA